MTFLPFLAAIYTFFAMPRNRGAPTVLIGNVKWRKPFPPTENGHHPKFQQRIAQRGGVFCIGQQVWELHRNVIVLERKWLQPSGSAGIIWFGIRVPSSWIARSHHKFCLANPARRTFGLLLAKVLLSMGSTRCRRSGDLPCCPMERWLLGMLTQMRGRNCWASRMVWERSCSTSRIW